MTLEDQLIRSLEALVVKNEITLRDRAEARLASRLPALKCSCESLLSGPGCLPCITKRARRVLDEAKASKAHVEEAQEIPPCGDCGKDSPDTATLKFDEDGNVTAQCRACYDAMREREMAGGGFVTNLPVAQANPVPCAHCPWRLANQGNPNDPHRFYGKANLARLWSKLRHGERMTCHPTDPRMSAYEHAPVVKDGTQTHECTGALTLQQREFMKFQEAMEHPLGSYSHRSPRMSKRGLLALVERSIVFPGETPMARPDLNDSSIGYEPLGAIS